MGRRHPDGDGGRGRPQKIFADNPSYPAAMGQYWFEPPISGVDDIANAVLFLACDESRTITGTQLTVDHGATKV